MAHRKGKDLPKWYFGCTSITVFHGQTLEYPRNRFSDNRVDGRDSTRGESHNGANSRSRALQCPIGRRWYIAEATVPSAAGNHYYASELAEFARTLYDQGYIGALGFRQIFERTGNSQFGPDGYQRYGDAMNRNFIIELQETAPGWEDWVTREIGDIHDGSSSS